MNEIKPLDLEVIADKIIRVEYPTYEQTTIPQMKNAIIRKKHLIKQILEQVIQSAVKGLLAEIDELIKWYEECRDKDYHIFTAKRDTAFRIKTKIKKWFPDVVKEEEV